MGQFTQPSHYGVYMYIIIMYTLIQYYNNANCNYIDSCLSVSFNQVVFVIYDKQIDIYNVYSIITLCIYMTIIDDM